MKNKKFFVGVKGVVIQDNKVLLVKANKKIEGRDHWEVPGGRIDDDETIEQALSRELFEEVGATNVRARGALSAWRIPRDIEEDTSLVLIFFKATADFNGEPKISEEHTEYKWATLEEATELAFPAVAEAIKAAFDK